MSTERNLDAQKRRGLMFVLSSPSGAGKTTLSRRLLEKHDKLTLSVSATTRPMRPGERDGVDYHFVSREKFFEMRDAGEFLEHAEVFGNFYGTPRAPVMAALEAGNDILFDIDWQGARQLQESAGADLVTVFILPPSKEELERRLYARAQDSPEEVARRMAKAGAEISHWAEYEYVFINYDLDDSERILDAILLAERMKRRRRTGLSKFIAELGL
ncbi:MAG: guanylate kinase [Parvularculaceae bacterium]